MLFGALEPGAANGPKVTHFALTNGLEVVVIPDHRAPVVTHMLWYKVGSADETPGKSGLAHFLEHLMFKGTTKNPAGRFSQVVATVGGQENAFTSSDYTGYFQRVPRDKLRAMMEFEADRMTGLVLTDDVVRPELASCWKSRTCGSPTIPRRGSARRWMPPFITITPMAGR
jgi:zinc protease